MNPDQLQPEVSDAVDFVRTLCDLKPQVAIILGSGLGGLADLISDATAIPFGSIPGFRTSSASGHRGQLILGQLERIPVIAMAGRLHRYEGWTNDEIAFPLQVMSALGANRLIVSNAAGGVNPKLRVGDIVVIRDHINWMGGGFRWNRNFDVLAPYRTELYDEEMSKLAIRTAVAQNFNAYEGSYLATLGPTYETRSEYRMMRKIGADVAGMSTVPEVLAASRLNMRILGLSMVSNVASPDIAVSANHQEVLEAGKAAEVKMEGIVRGVLSSLH
ncbi:MAG: purine-nucleoside phosphorylase [Rubripirellula sp.]